MMNKRIRIILFLICYISTIYADTIELPFNFSVQNITSQSSLLKENTSSFEKIKDNQSFEPITDYYFNKGTAHSIYWAKVNIRTKASQKIYFEYVQPHTNYIQFFIQRDTSLETSPLFGDYLPFKKRPYPHRNMVMPIELTAHQSTTIYIMIDKRNEALNGSFKVWNEDHFEQTETRNIGFYGLVFGWHSIYLIWVFIIWLIVKKRMLGFYALFMLMTLLYSLNNTGLGLQYLWTNGSGVYASLWFQATIFGMNLSLLLFNVHFFNTKINYPKLHFLLKTLIIAGVTLNLPHYLIILTINDFPDWYLQLVQVSFGLFFLLVVIGFFSCSVLSFLDYSRQRTVSSIFMMIPYIIYTVLVGILVLTILGIDFRLGEMIGHEETTSLILFEITFFTIAVFLRIYAINQEREQLKLEVAQSELKAAKARFDGRSIERKRISRDLHDSVGANLTRIITDLDLLNLQVDRQSKDKILLQIDNTRDFTQSTVQLLRDTIWAMNKDEFSVDEFILKVEAFLGYYLGNKINWSVSSDLQKERQLTPTQVLNLLRILQEATQNMLKHSNATHFNVIISSTSIFKIIIEDNGVGMNTLAVQPDDNYGLYNMKKRAEDIEARLNITSVIGQGVQLELVFNKKSR